MMPELDELTITGLRVFAHHGVFDHERRDGQPFIIDATLRLPLAAAGATDELARTVHYGVLAEEIVAAVERDPVDLIETVAERVVDVVLAHESVVSVRVTVHKPEAPIGVPFEDVSVSMTRTVASRMPAVRGSAPVPTLRHWELSAVTRAVVAMGSNLGDRESTLRDAVAELDAEPGVRVVSGSPLVQTLAVKLDGVDESAPEYLNAVIGVDTVLSPRALLSVLQRIESRHGRTREVRWGDRTLDLDLVAYGSVAVLDQDLVVPHPRAHERAFVLDPWSRMDADAVVPGRGPVAELLAGVLAATGERVELFPAPPLVAPVDVDGAPAARGSAWATP